MAEVRLAPQAKKQFDKLPKTAKLKIHKALLKLENNSLIGKKLKGELEGEFSLKVWPYRIIYQFFQKEKVVYIISIIHRQSAYN